MALIHLKAFKALQKHFKATKHLQMRNMFECDALRFEKFSVQLNELLFDYSKNRITDETMPLLINLAKESHLDNMIEAMFKGQPINFTENRPVLHTALRNLSNTPVIVDGKDVMPQINAVLEKMHTFSDSVRTGRWKGASGKKITDVVNIGIGGSDLGPCMVVEALKKYKIPHIRFHFVSNIDGTDISETLKECNPETTLFLIASKTFTTQETMVNAKSARNWVINALGEKAVKKHFVALSTNTAEVEKFGINPQNMFEFWDFVGGRYSIWSAIGLSIMISIGYNAFIEMLQGAHEMDIHFRTAPFHKNIQVILGLLSIWYHVFYQAETFAVLPYDKYLCKLPAYLQQLEMESNGKYNMQKGDVVSYPTGAILFGEAGTNGQHSFYQLIHQGTHLIPCDFIVPVHSLNPLGVHHDILLANALAQPEALMKGKTEKEAKDEGINATQIPFRTFPGNRPSNSIIINELTPKNLGRLIAIYEHKVFAVGCILNVNSFDQWGVELGKSLAKKILPELSDGKKTTSHDCSTNALINYIKGVHNE